MDFMLVSFKTRQQGGELLEKIQNENAWKRHRVHI